MVTSVSYDTAACEGMVVVTEEMEGQWAGQISLQAGPNTISGWTVEMEFTSTVDWIESVMAQVDIQSFYPLTCACATLVCNLTAKTNNGECIVR